MLITIGVKKGRELNDPSVSIAYLEWLLANEHYKPMGVVYLGCVWREIEARGNPNKIPCPECLAVKPKRSQTATADRLASIIEKAKAHKAVYPTFNLDRFTSEIEDRREYADWPAFIRRISGKPIAEINVLLRRRRNNAQLKAG